MCAVSLVQQLRKGSGECILSGELEKDLCPSSCHINSHGPFPAGEAFLVMGSHFLLGWVSVKRGLFLFCLDCYLLIRLARLRQFTSGSNLFYSVMKVLSRAVLLAFSSTWESEEAVLHKDQPVLALQLVLA